MAQPQALGRQDGDGRGRLALPGEDVEDDIGRVDALAQGLGTGRLDRRQPVTEHSGEDLDHLPVTPGTAGELASNPVEGGGQHPVLERCAVPERARFAGEHRDVVPGIEHGLIPAEGTRVLGDDAPVLPDLDALGVGSHFDRAANGGGHDRVSVVVEAYEAGRGHRSGDGVEAVEAASIGHQRRPLGLEPLPDGALALLGMRMGLGVGDSSIE
ncbi:hypothetical protein AUT27_15060 [Enterococcus faecium]|nr:hypothetical protein AUT27_15060 [Enterococcus faecium]